MNTQINLALYFEPIFIFYLDMYTTPFIILLFQFFDIPNLADFYPIKAIQFLYK